MKMSNPMAGLAVALGLMVPLRSDAAEQPVRALTSEQSGFHVQVSQAEQDTAEEILQAGNQLMKQLQFPEAEGKYREALTHWDHPGLRYNRALALIQLNQPIDAYHELELVLAAPEDALDTDKRDNAKIHKASLDQQLARVELACENPGAEAKVGGEPVPLVNGHHEQLMRAGSIVVSAKAPGYQDREKTFTLEPGKHNRLNLRLYRDTELIEYKPRWSTWKPWAVVGAGAAAAASGGLFYVKARRDYRAFDDHVSDCSADAGGKGCRETELVSRRSRLQMLNRASVGAMSLGGAVLATGAVLLLINRADAHPLDAEELDRRNGLTVTPVVGRDGNGVLLTLQH